MCLVGEARFKKIGLKMGKSDKKVGRVILASSGGRKDWASGSRVEWNRRERLEL